MAAPRQACGRHFGEDGTRPSRHLPPLCRLPQVATAKAGVAGRNSYKQEAQVLKEQWQKRKGDLEKELEAARKEQGEADGEWCS